MCIKCNIYKTKYHNQIHLYDLKLINELKNDYILLLKCIQKKDNCSIIEYNYCRMLINVIKISNIELIDDDIKELKKDFLELLDNYTNCKK